MKSNQERSNGCLPPKKREMLALEQRPVVVAAAPAAALVADSPHTENLAWLASVASERCRFRDTESPRCPVSSSSSFSSASFSSSSFSSSSSSSPATPLSTVPLASLPAVYPTALPQQSGTIQYAQLGPNVQFISSGPYAGYISSHIIPANHHHHSAHNSSGATGQRHPQLDGYTTALISPGHKGEHQFQIGLSPADLAAVSLSNSAQVTGQYIHLDGSAALTDSHLQLHAHPTVLPHTLTLGPSQLVVQYTDSSAGKKVDGHSKGFLNGELEVVKHTKVCQPVNHHQQVQSYEARHILLPAEYTQNPSGLQTSLVLVAQPNSGADSDHHNKVSLLQTEKGGICLGKPVSRASSFSSLSSTEALKSSTQHTVIQTTLSHEELPANLYSSTQPPIIGYIASAGHPHAVSYHATLPQHLVIPSGQSLLIPVSATTSATAIPHISTAMPHAYLATALSKCEVLGSEGHQPHPAVSQAPVLSILPPHPAPAVVAPPYPATAPTPAAAAPAPAPHAQISIQASPSPSSSASPATLPPFFMRGSIIQLADGELKRVEDLKTEDFIQSAEISSELKIDSSTVERIDGGQTPNAVVIQFAVGELKAQVCVEVLLEYPFFVFGQGWSSCCPDRTTQLFELSCAKLCVGDVCVSLTLRGLRNGSVTSSQALETRLRTSHNSSSSSSSCPPHGTEPAVRNSTGPHAAGSNSGLLMKAAAGSDRLERGQATGPGPGEAAVYGGARAASDTPPPASAGGLAGRGPVKADMPPPPSSTQTGDPDRPAGRKRRWSAPERDQTERAEEEPPLTLPKPSFIVQEVKLSMEGRASTGK